MLRNSEHRKSNHTGFVIALNDNNLSYEYPEEVKLTIKQEYQEDYLKAVKFINLSGADLCILEHEFGIFGGQSGVYILPLLHRLEVPLIVTLHTILKAPSYNEKAILKEICKMAHKIVVMNGKAIEFLTSIYNVPKEKIVLIEQGVPDIHFDQLASKKEFKLEHKKIIQRRFTGIRRLLSRGMPVPSTTWGASTTRVRVYHKIMPKRLSGIARLLSRAMLKLTTT